MTLILSDAQSCQVVQIPCGSRSLPPGGCLQHHTGITGQVRSFNFLATSYKHLSDQYYKVREHVTYNEFWGHLMSLTEFNLTEKFSILPMQERDQGFGSVWTLSKKLVDTWTCAFIKHLFSLLRFVSGENRVTARLAGPWAQIQTHSKFPGMLRVICHYWYERTSGF